MASIKAAATIILLRTNQILLFDTLFLYIQQLAFIKKISRTKIIDHKSCAFSFLKKQTNPFPFCLSSTFYLRQFNASNNARRPPQTMVAYSSHCQPTHHTRRCMNKAIEHNLILFHLHGHGHHRRSFFFLQFRLPPMHTRLNSQRARIELFWPQSRLPLSCSTINRNVRSNTSICHRFDLRYENACWLAASTLQIC